MRRLSWKKRWVSFDSECSGTCLEDRLIALDTVYFEDGVPVPGSRKTVWLNPGSVWEARANTVDPARPRAKWDLTNKPTFAVVADEILRMLDYPTLVGYYVDFEFAFLAREFDLIGRSREWAEFLGTRLVLDTQALHLFRRPNEASSPQQDEVAKRWGVPDKRYGGIDGEVSGRILAAMKDLFPSSTEEMASIQRRANLLKRPLRLKSWGQPTSVR
jgi:DNA polymerase III epsilon subunit-like protein